MIQTPPESEGVVTVAEMWDHKRHKEPPGGLCALVPEVVPGRACALPRLGLAGGGGGTTASEDLGCHSAHLFLLTKQTSLLPSSKQPQVLPATVPHPEDLHFQS